MAGVWCSTLIIALKNIRSFVIKEGLLFNNQFQQFPLRNLSRSTKKFQKFSAFFFHISRIKRAKRKDKFQTSPVTLPPPRKRNHCSSTVPAKKLNNVLFPLKPWGQTSGATAALSGNPDTVGYTVSVLGHVALMWHECGLGKAVTKRNPCKNKKALLQGKGKPA